MRLILACLGLLLTGPALAQPAAIAAYEAGDWAQAQALAGGGSGAAAQTLAAEAALAPLILGEMNAAGRLAKRTRALEAVAFAESALALDPDNPRAHLALAAALGYEARYTNPLRAALSGLPQRGRTHIERALAIDPSNPWAHALLGAWHLEIVRRAGERTFGADSETGLQRYRAATRNSDNPAIHYHFALALLALDARTHGDEALAQLAAAASTDADSAFDAAMRAHARSLMEITETYRSAGADEAVRRLQD